MTLAEVAATQRKKHIGPGSPCEYEESRDALYEEFEEIIAAFEADPDFMLRERFTDLIDRWDHALVMGEQTVPSRAGILQTFRTALGPSPGPTLRERVEKLAKEYLHAANDVKLGNHDQKSSWRGFALRLREALNPPKKEGT